MAARRLPARTAEPGTLILRVEGPAAIEIQHLANLICERVNRSSAGAPSVASRCARRRSAAASARRTRAADPAAAARIAASLPEIGDDDLKDALARLGAAIKRAREASGPSDASGRKSTWRIGVLMPHSRCNNLRPQNQELTLSPTRRQLLSATAAFTLAGGRLRAFADRPGLDQSGSGG